MCKSPFEEFLKTYEEEITEDTQAGMTYSMLEYWLSKAYEAGKLDSILKKAYHHK